VSGGAASPEELEGMLEGARHTAEHIQGARFTSCPSGEHVWVGHQQDIMSEVIAVLKERSGIGSGHEAGAAKDLRLCSGVLRT
jgi:hypothetical protein